MLKNLKTKIQKIIDTENVKKVNIVAHSLDGLIAKKYVLNNKTDTKVEKLITLGTPFFGSPYAFVALNDGHTFKKIEILDKKNARTYQFFTIYCLQNYILTLIIQTYFVEENQKENLPTKLYTYQEVSDLIKDKFDKDLYKSEEEFHDEMTDSVGKYVDFYRIVGETIILLDI